MSSIKFSALALLIAATSFAGSARATILTQTFVQPIGPTTWSLPNVTFNQFNPALGTLNSVFLSYSGSFSQSEVISVPVAVPSQTISSLSAAANVLIFDQANFTSQIVDISATQNVISFPGVTINPGASQSFNASGAMSFGPASRPTAPYLGVSTKSFSLGGTGGFTVSGGGQANFAVNTQSGGTLSLVYDFTPATTSAVPEPTSAIVFVGLLATVPFARRRVARV